ncbi:sigma factor-like helix-turn-helix DNA-binding protein [Streptomyces sp. NEAU-YJ-81]|uniref:sigma factor-like helix-turn-helix DNA-binding protein n=1 Tax=Streptomyces sp. NEAU-YJ-81 TaxID=2820288 RepID=UPI001ABD429C|nr:sigma factor-like helix-turn-helix DNA-binding protein [Streptomyces sp. NEAU-YJ-81]MBO3679186.1 RNA polymerase subunit sigma [Streptomyces sp. NEAU-YJ-81]
MEHADAVPIAELLDERRYLLDVAYWMLGGPREAENVVDETYRRWYGLSDAERRQITAARSWLAKTAGGICLNRLTHPDRGTTGQKEDHRTETGDAEGARTRLVEEVSRVLLKALDSLPPPERAAFVLHDAFGMAPGTVADIVGRSEPECAELADRARHSLRMRHSRPTTPDEHDALAHAVRRACVSEDAELLASLLCPDATAFFDGGGKVRTLIRPAHGSRQVAHSLLTLLAHRPRTTLTTHSVNGRTGLVARYDRQVAAVISLDITDRRVAQVWVVLNPEKLRSWNQPPAPDGPGSHQGPAQRSDGRS